MAIDGKGLGWVPDYPDFRDRTLEHDAVRQMLHGSRAIKASPPKLAASVDLRAWCPPVEDQEQLGSCTAQAGVGLVEYYERRAFGRHLDASRRFLYKVTRNLMHWTGDTGAYVRTTLKAMVLFGVPPEEYWPYDIGAFDAEPSAFCYAFAQSYQTISYVRLDPPGVSASALLASAKRMLACGYPSAFGFTVYRSISQASGTGEIPFPSGDDSAAGGHAVVAVGYDDAKKIRDQKGALLIRNSWGTGWGQQGYGWLPYAYLEAGLARDFWTVLKQEWVDSKRFE